jgi:hypothetical protein
MNPNPLDLSLVPEGKGVGSGISTTGRSRYTESLYRGPYGNSYGFSGTGGCGGEPDGTGSGIGGSYSTIMLAGGGFGCGSPCEGSTGFYTGNGNGFGGQGAPTHAIHFHFRRIV